MLRTQANSQSALEHTTSPQGFVVLNPVAGKGNPEEIKEKLHTSLGEDSYDLYETTGEEQLRDVVHTALQQHDYAWVAAIGGDGTVSQVADGLVGTEVPLAIIPAGTGNVLAQELGIPQETEAACDLLTAGYATRQIDGIQVGEHYFFLQLGIGLESVTMENTPSAKKNRWGMAAYLWTLIKEAFGWQPHQFWLSVDGERHHIEASELVVANASQIGVLNLNWHDDIVPDDGVVNVAVVRARSLADYWRVVWAGLRGQQGQSRHIQFFAVHDQLHLEAERPLPIHGDGEILDIEMPFTAVVVPSALTVIVPHTHQKNKENQTNKE